LIYQSQLLANRTIKDGILHIKIDNLSMKQLNKCHKMVKRRKEGVKEGKETVLIYCISIIYTPSLSDNK
jgi:hypothetical protein